jgi:exodeoxyribonuclease V alpha subunit
MKSGLTVDLNDTKYSGKLKQIVWKSQKNSFKILNVNGVSCKGRIDEPQIGVLYEFVGHYEENAKFNTWDFVFTSYSGTIDASAGLVEYLVREAPNLGGANASRIVAAFGNDAIRIMATDANRLTEIPGLSYKSRTELAEWAKGESNNAATKVKLYKLGLLPGLVSKLMRAFGRDAERKIKEDCYALSKIDGIGFRTVALVADALGIPADDPGRIKAGILHQIEVMQEDGHSCIHRNELIRESCNLLMITHDKVTIQLDALLEEQLLLDDAVNFTEYAQSEGIMFDGKTPA